eukprot:scaffold70680_cov15-Tisochrysis_lutea.AAC.2
MHPNLYLWGVVAVTPNSDHFQQDWGHYLGKYPAAQMQDSLEWRMRPAFAQVKCKEWYKFILAKYIVLNKPGRAG